MEIINLKHETENPDAGSHPRADLRHPRVGGVGSLDRGAVRHAGRRRSGNPSNLRRVSRRDSSLA